MYAIRTDIMYMYKSDGKRTHVCLFNKFTYLTRSCENDLFFIIYIYIYKNVHSCTHASRELQQYKQSALNNISYNYLAFNYNSIYDIISNFLL